MTSSAIDADRTPVIVGIGEISDDTAKRDGPDSLDLMHTALRRAEHDAGATLLDGLDWLGVVDQISCRVDRPHHALAARLPTQPRHLVKTAEASGDGPVRLLLILADAIERGEMQVGAIVGGEALRTAAAAARFASDPSSLTAPADPISTAAAHGASALARRYGLVTPLDVYPLYENAARAAWHQDLATAQAESATIWSLFSQVAAANPNAWLRSPKTPSEIAEVTAANRMVSFPYVKLMVANPSVNLGAAAIVCSLSFARALGIPPHRLVQVGGGATADEHDDVLRRASYDRLPSMESTITGALERSGIGRRQIDHLELYSCFPCVPKMARRVLDWPVDRVATVYGGLTFGGAPVGNCMTHAIAQMVARLREGGNNGLIVANGGYATHSAAVVLHGPVGVTGALPRPSAGRGDAGPLPADGPALIDDFVGDGTIETFTIPCDRQGRPGPATVIARTDDGRRFPASVPATDEAALAVLMGSQGEPVGRAGRAVRGDQMTMWTMTAAA